MKELFEPFAAQPARPDAQSEAKPERDVHRDASRKLKIAPLFKALAMARADSYDFVCLGGFVHTVPGEQIPDCAFGWIGERVDGFAPGIGGGSLHNLHYIVPTGVNEQTIDPNGGVQRIILFENGAYRAGLAPSDQPRGGGCIVTKCYSFSEFASANLWTEPQGEIAIVGMDGYIGIQPYENILPKYVTFGFSKAPTFAGAASDIYIEPWFTAYLNLGAEAVAFAPYTPCSKDE
ncbi:MAG: hypothetical protein AAGU74_05335 [Bacillota bacterium]